MLAAACDLYLFFYIYIPIGIFFGGGLFDRFPARFHFIDRIARHVMN